MWRSKELRSACKHKGFLHARPNNQTNRRRAGKVIRPPFDRPMKKTFTTMMVVSLVGNVFPAFNIVAICALFPLYLLNRKVRTGTTVNYGPTAARKYLFVAYAYWICSYFVTAAPIANLFSFDFIRFDGALLIAYVPLLVVTDLRLDPAFIRRSVSLFLSTMSVVALLGLAEFVDSTFVPLGLSWL